MHPYDESSRCELVAVLQSRQGQWFPLLVHCYRPECCGADSGVMSVLKIVDLSCVSREELNNGRFCLLLFDGVLLLQGLLLVELNELVPSKELRFGLIVKVSKLKAKAYQLNAGKVKRGVILTSECPDRRSIENRTPSLPTELWFNILALLPADVLYNVMRYICSQWYKIIHDPVFIKMHLLRTNAGLFKGRFYSPDAYYADTSTVDVTVERINFKFSGYVWCSCDGLVLFSDPEDSAILRIVNPITKQHVTLPRFKPSSFVYHFVLAHGCSTGDYKVVGTCTSRDGKVLRCVILTVGKDLTWRKIDTHHISVNQQLALMNRPYFAGGYVFWIVCCYPDFLTFDVEAEVLRHFPIPKPPDTYKCHIFYGEMGNSLCCIFWPDHRLVFEVLVLSDPSSGKWENLYKLDLEGKRHMINSSLMSEDASPLACVNNGKVIVFSTLLDPGTNYVAHNVETGETYSFCMYKNKYQPLWLVHVNSLVSLDL